MELEHCLAVYDIDDQSKGSVVVVVDGKRVTLTPGQHVLISKHHSRQFQDVNAIELVPHRGVNRSSLSNGWHMYTSEFSIPSACFSVKPLRDIAGAKHHESARLRSQLLKTTAVIMNLRPDRGDFVQYFNPRLSAMAVGSN